MASSASSAVRERNIFRADLSPHAAWRRTMVDHVEFVRTVAVRSGFFECGVAFSRLCPDGLHALGRSGVSA